MFRIRIALSCFTLIGCVIFSDIASAASQQVVIEFFGKNNCAGDTIIQETLQDILKSKTNIILINCRTFHEGAKEVKTFSLKFCNNRKELYNKKFSEFTMGPSSIVIVNGRWDASYKDLEPALNLGKTDNVETILVNIKDGILDISIPKINSDIGHGELLLYTYVPTIDEKAVFIDADVELTDKMKENINSNISIPFVTKTRTTPFYLRPILATQRIGKWSGKQMNLTLPLDEITSLSGSSYPDLSYIVVLHDGGEAGDIIAAGEHISTKEMNNTLPHSEPHNIKLISPDPKSQVQ